MIIVIATATHKHGLYIRGKFYEVIDTDTKRNQINVWDERKLGCWYSWEDFVRQDDFNDTMKTREINRVKYDE